MTKDFFDKTTKTIFLSQQVADERIMIFLIRSQALVLPGMTHKR